MHRPRIHHLRIALIVDLVAFVSVVQLFVPQPAWGKLCAYAALENHQIAVIDVTSNTVAGYVRLPHPQAVAFAADGTRAYVASASSLIAIDTGTHGVMEKIEGLDSDVVDLAVSSDGSRVFSLGRSVLQIVDVAAARLATTIPLGGISGTAPEACYLRLGPDQRFVHVVECQGRVLTVDTHAHPAAAVIRETVVGDGIAGVAIASDGATLYLAQNETLSALDPFTGLYRWRTQASAWLDDVSLAPDGQHLLLIVGGWTAMWAVRAADGTLIGTTALPDYGKLSAAPDGTVGYLNNLAKTLFRLNLRTLESEGEIAFDEWITDVALGDLPTCTVAPLPTPTLPPAPPCDHSPAPLHECLSGTVCLEVGSASGAAGESVIIDVVLRTDGNEVVATQNALSFDAGATVTACEPNPQIEKDNTTIVFRPLECAAGIDCGSVLALVLSFARLDPIPDGSVLYRCHVRIHPASGPRVFRLRIEDVQVSTGEGEPLPTSGADGEIIVVGDQESPCLEIGGAASQAAGCQVTAAQNSGIAWHLPLGAWLLRRRRARQVSNRHR